MVPSPPLSWQNNSSASQGTVSVSLGNCTKDTARGRSTLPVGTRLRWREELNVQQFGNRCVGSLSMDRLLAFTRSLFVEAPAQISDASRDPFSGNLPLLDLIRTDA